MSTGLGGLPTPSAVGVQECRKVTGLVYSLRARLAQLLLRCYNSAVRSTVFVRTRTPWPGSSAGRAQP